MNILELPFVGGHLNYGMVLFMCDLSWFQVRSLFLKVKGNLQPHVRHEKMCLHFFSNYDLRFMPGILHKSKAYLFLWDF